MNFSNLTEAQQNALKDLAILGAIYFGTKTASAALRYGVIAGVGFLLWRNYSSVQAGSPGLAGGWKMKVDPGLAVDMAFPNLGDSEKMYAKMAAAHVFNGLLNRG